MHKDRVEYFYTLRHRGE